MLVLGWIASNPSTGVELQRGTEMKLQYQELPLGHAAAPFQSRISEPVLEPLQSVYNLSVLGSPELDLPLLMCCHQH